MTAEEFGQTLRDTYLIDRGLTGSDYRRLRVGRYERDTVNFLLDAGILSTT